MYTLSIISNFTEYAYYDFENILVEWLLEPVVLLDIGDISHQDQDCNSDQSIVTTVTAMWWQSDEL